MLIRPDQHNIVNVMDHCDVLSNVKMTKISVDNIMVESRRLAELRGKSVKVY